MRRVLFVDHVNRILGGAEINLIELLAETSGREDWQVECACVQDSRLAEAVRRLKAPVHHHGFSEELNQLRVVGSRPSLAKAFAGLRAMRQARERLAGILDRSKPDAVITCSNKDHLCAAPITHARGIRSIWWVNDILSPEFFPWYARQAFVRNARKHASGLAAVSEFGRSALLEQGVSSAKAVTIHNGIPLDRYQRTPRGALRRQIDAEEGTPLIGLIARITPWKGQEFFVRLAEASQAAHPDARFAIIGNAFNEDQPFEQALRQQVQERQLQERVHFVPFRDDIAAVLSDLDLLIHASQRPEPFGRVIIEAMAVSVPVIAARAGGVPEIVTHGMDGLLAEPGNLPEYLGCLTRILSEPQTAVGFTQVARKTVEKRFTIQRVRQQFETLLGEPTF